MDSADEPSIVDDALKNYMYELERCALDFAEAPPALHAVAPNANLQYPTTTADAELYDALFPSVIQTTSAATGFEPEQVGLPEQEAVNEPNATTATKRTEAWAAKNRRAQKRFRERQKVVQQYWSVASGSRVCNPAADQMLKELRRLRKGKWSNSFQKWQKSSSSLRWITAR